MFPTKRISDWLLNRFREASEDIVEPKDSTQEAVPEQPEDPENHYDPPPSKPPSSGSSSSGSKKRKPGRPKETSTESKSPAKSKSTPSSGSSEFPMRDPSVSKGKAVQTESPEEKSLASSSSSEFPMRDPNISRGKAVQIGSPEEKSQASSSSPEFSIRDPNVSRGKATQIGPPEKEGSQASSSNPEFPIRNSGALVATEIPLRPRQQSSLSSSGDWPPTHDPRQRQPGALTGRQGLGIYAEEEVEEPHDQERPRPFIPDYYWGTRHRARSPRNLGSQDTEPLLDDPDELYNASPRRNDTVSSDWSLHRPLDDPFFNRNNDGGSPDPPLNEPEFQPRGRLRVVNPIPLQTHDPYGEQPDRNQYVPRFNINPLQGLRDPGGQRAEGTGLQGFMADPVSKILVESRFDYNSYSTTSLTLTFPAPSRNQRLLLRPIRPRPPRTLQRIQSPNQRLHLRTPPRSRPRSPTAMDRPTRPAAANPPSPRSRAASPSRRGRFRHRRRPQKAGST